MSKKYALLDGEAMNREHPDTFGLPSNHEIGNLRKGNYIKIGATFAPNRRNGSLQFKLWQAKVGPLTAANTTTERFWVLLTTDPFQVDNVLRYRGIIDNDLAYTPEHGLRFGATITVERKHILATNI